MTAAPDPQAPTGLHALGLASGRDGLFYVPAGYTPSRPPRLVVMFHGAGGVAAHAIDILRPHADEHGLLLVAPDSRGRTWDVILGGYGPDVEFLRRALEKVSSTYAVQRPFAVGGFSDGASYALSIGLMNGDTFGHILAFSPGFSAAQGRQGEPRVFVRHGVDDRVLPIGSTSRRLVPRLRAEGYDVDYEEFDDGHVVPERAVDEALEWLATPRR